MIRTIGPSLAAMCLWSGCASMMAQSGEGRTRDHEAELFVEQAADACRMAEMKGLPAAAVQAQQKAFDSFVQQAEEKDVLAFDGDDKVKGTVRSRIKAECPPRMKAALAIAEKTDAEVEARDSAELQARKEKLAALRAALKGDRSRIFEMAGEPFKFDGQLETARYWQYAVSVSTERGDMDCSVTYHFKGNKLARRELASFCTADPHPDTMSLMPTMTMTQ